MPLSLIYWVLIGYLNHGYFNYQLFVNLFSLNSQALFTDMKLYKSTVINGTNTRRLGIQYLRI